MPATLFELLPDAQAIFELEPEDLAGIALELIASGVQLHPAAFCSVETLGAFPQQSRDNLMQALAEAWHWLVQEGLLAPRPGDTAGWHFLTRRGRKVRNREGLASYVSSVLLPKKLLHPGIVASSWASFLRGDYDTAVFQAFKELEVEIRDAAKLKPEDYGVDLARKAFAENNGPLTDMSKPVAERLALAHLMAGALGSYKNPHSHRKVKLGAEESVEMVMLASHLLKIVDARRAP